MAAMTREEFFGNYDWEGGLAGLFDWGFTPGDVQESVPELYEDLVKAFEAYRVFDVVDTRVSDLYEEWVG